MESWLPIKIKVNIARWHVKNLIDSHDWLFVFVMSHTCFQSESSLYTCLNVKELFARVGWVFVYELSGTVFESSCSHSMTGLEEGLTGKHCVKYRNFTQFFGVEILWEGIVSALSRAIPPETMKNMCLSKKFPHQKIRWNYGILCNKI